MVGWAIGYFPTYALGNVISVQLWDKLRGELPDLDSQFEKGEFGELAEWLRENLHQHGRKYTSKEMLDRIVGGPMDLARTCAISRRSWARSTDCQSKRALRSSRGRLGRRALPAPARRARASAGRSRGRARALDALLALSLVSFFFAIVLSQSRSILATMSLTLKSRAITSSRAIGVIGARERSAAQSAVGRVQAQLFRVAAGVCSRALRRRRARRLVLTIILRARLVLEASIRARRRRAGKRSPTTRPALRRARRARRGSPWRTPNPAIPSPRSHRWVARDALDSLRGLRRGGNRARHRDGGGPRVRAPRLYSAGLDVVVRPVPRPGRRVFDVGRVAPRPAPTTTARQQGEDEADDADDHQDHADRVEVQARGLVGYAPREDGSAAIKSRLTGIPIEPLVPVCEMD